MDYYYVYILYCNDGTYYTGVTNNLDRRLQEHMIGICKTSYTYSRRPTKLVYSIDFIDINDAIEYEKIIKKWSKAKKEALIAGDWERLSLSAKKIFN